MLFTENVQHDYIDTFNLTNNYFVVENMIYKIII